MIAYKFLSDEGLGRFSEARWPLPVAGAPGAWLEASLPLAPCVRGIHALRACDLPFWLDRQLYEIELAGEIVAAASMVVAQRGRLVRRVDAWNEASWAALGDFCKQRTQANAERVAAQAPHELTRARFFVSEVDTFIGLGAYPTAIYVAAVAAHVASPIAPEAAYQAERAEQARFLAALLGLSA
jgi:hypothetical protein